MALPGSISLVIALPESMAGQTAALDAFRAELDPARGDEILIETAHDRSTLVPRLWARGIARARGEIVALTLGSMRPEPGWAEAVRAAMRDGAAGVGGAIEPSGRPSALDAAVHLCRYSRYLLPFERGPAGDLPGDNAAYRRAALEECRAVWKDGFWETEVDAELRRRGASLELDPSMVVRHGRSVGFLEFCENRFRHGIRSGQARSVVLSPTARFVRTLAAPLVPLVLLQRIARRAAPRGHGLRLLRSAPLLLIFLSVWAAGETLGYWRSRDGSWRSSVW